MSTDIIRAAVCRRFGAPLELEDLVLAAPGETDVRVAVGAVAVCHSDISFIDGHWGGDLPAVWGHEAAGVVQEVGTGVDNVAGGDHVVITLVRSCGECRQCNMGLSVVCSRSGELAPHDALSTRDGDRIAQGLRTAGFAEQVVVHHSQIVKIPEQVPLDVASLLACGVATGYGAVANTANPPAGSSAVVVGTGGVGLHAVQAARDSGVDPLIAVDISGDKLKWAGRLGATHLIDASVETVPAAVAAATGGKLADYVFVTTAAPAAIDESQLLAAPGGTVVIVGMPPSGVMMHLDTATLAAANQRLLGTKMGTVTVRRDIPALVELYVAGRLELDSLISGRFAFDDINAAIDDARGGAPIRNVIMMDPA